MEWRWWSGRKIGANAYSPDDLCSFRNTTHSGKI